MNAPSRDSVTVIGAGIVGLSIALRLQMDGRAVTVIDKSAPMSGCSSGNAGYLSPANIYPPAAKDVLRRLPALLLSRTGPLTIRPTYLPRWIPWGIRALQASNTEATKHIATSMASLMKRSLSSFDALLGEAGAQHLIDRRGGLMVYRTNTAFEAKQKLLAQWNGLGIGAEAISAAAVRELEPALSPEMVGGILFPGAGRCLNPRELGLAYCRRFQQRGGSFIRGRVTRITPNAAQPAVRLSDGQDICSAKLVVCTGFESSPLQRLLRFHLPLASERGYHLMLRAPGLRLNRPVVFGESLFGAVSMQDGLRLAGTAEFAFARAPAAMQRAHMLLPLAQTFLPQLDGRAAVPWMGVRPSLPDGMPAIGALAAHPEILYAIGHSHNGLTTSAITARCISDLLGDKPATVDLRPFAIERFSRQTSTAPST